MDKRFLRHYILPELGEICQKKISNSSTLVVGIGGLGSAAIIYLVANGIGKIGIVDYDKVDITNLHRQIIHYTSDVGKPKILSAKEKIKKINPSCEVETYQLQLTSENIAEIVEKYDFIIEATDNIETKMLINDTCVKLKKAFSHAGINKFFGSTLTVVPGESACLRCVFKKIQPQSDEPPGVFGPVPGVLGIIQASEALKYLGGFGNLLKNRILFIDLYNMNFRITNIKKDENCICSI